ncbi:hypothetical protein SARC_02914 [Sphaeroforma arctica JP610]|uniref:Rap-GAP domain-containing protein n=1 Tax=Sphaeroforma arctica JP610 TaxID=667725 RepID=A0A0L0G787_9EUKA|nr:hypothetical protein SARC_02914 [Sphaeroforma arctica JP610]KNC84875.1 hypothetical protein SARC_02914 [Sphaeroforma arctica JP610]|eukprot:XP_014158777.1 hypothetical protein SARC_02914 [Sphaeroforma arctica JP610]
MSGAALSHPMLADSDDGEEIELLRATSNGFLKAVEDEDHVRTPSRTHSLLITATYDSEHDTRDVDDYGEGALSSDVESCPRKQVQVQTNSARGQSAKVLVRPRDSKCSSVGLAGYGHPSKPHPQQTQAVKDAVMVRSSSPLARPTHGQTPQIHPPTHTSISIQATHTIDTPTTSGSGRSASPTNTSVQTHVTLPASGTHTVASAFYLETDPESSAHDHTGTNEPRTAPHTTVDNKRGQGITVAEVGRPLRGSIRSTSESDLAAMAAALPTASAVKRRPKPQPMRCSAPSLTQSQLRMFKQGLARGQDDSDVSDDSTGHHDAEWLRDEALRKPLVLRGGDFVVEPIVGHCAEGSQYQLDIRNNTGFYQSYFFGKEHVNYFAIDQYLGKLVISIRKERVRSNDPNMKDAQYRVCFRSEMSEDENLVIPDTWVKGWKKSKRASMATSKVAIRDVINFALPRLQLLTKLTAPASEKESLGANLSMLLLDKDELIKAYKFGVMYCKEGQTTENAMFANEHGSEHYNDFLELIGSKVRLNGFKSFRGGLDVKGDTTGKYSVFTFWNNLEIMLHVSTLLPFQADNEQQLFRKAHIGNDIVVLVYVEGDAVFDPAALVAQFPHVFIVVRLERTEPTRRYRVEVAARKGVPEFLPQVPMYFEHDSKLRDFILSKMINGENASYKAPKFRKIRQRTRRLLLNNLFDEFMPGLSPK